MVIRYDLSPVVGTELCRVVSQAACRRAMRLDPTARLSQQVLNSRWPRWQRKNAPSARRAGGVRKARAEPSGRGGLWLLGRILDRHADHAAVLGPRAVVVLDVR